MQKIGLGVIGINPTNMGSTMSLLSGEADLRYELRALCAKREITWLNMPKIWELATGLLNIKN